ncbi:MAG: type II toxin-antitoxin system ParD family antitoxin [Gammaproteobacteria bacterium]|nr:type II toxin-antitoxin system ParD family antitoxin [Gammaproteobacteria bacterium]
MIKKSITVTHQQEKWIQAQVAKGHYASDSEIFRDLIRERQARESENLEIQAIRAALIEAEEQGFSDQTPEQIKATVIKQREGSGQL